MKVPFYILGLLIRYGPEHGYRLKQIMETQIADFAQIKLPNLYYHLEKLADKGYVSASPERAGKRQEKMVYRITQAGRTYFAALCRKLLKEELLLELPLDGLLFFRECISGEEIVRELCERKTALERRMKLLEAHRAVSMPQVPEEGKTCAGLIFDHHRFHMEAELMWIEKALRELT